jgi:hypothetical protein
MKHTRRVPNMKKPYVRPGISTLESRDIIAALGPATTVTSPDKTPPGD